MLSKFEWEAVEHETMEHLEIPLTENYYRLDWYSHANILELLIEYFN